MEKIQDINIETYSPITPPELYRSEVPMSDKSKRVVIESRKVVSDIIHGRDKPLNAFCRDESQKHNTPQTGSQLQKQIR